MRKNTYRLDLTVFSLLLSNTVFLLAIVPFTIEHMSDLTSIELFAGGGGLLLGTALAGFKHLCAAEWERNCCDTLRLNKERGYPLIGDTPIIQDDVRNIDWSQYEGQVDLLAGGPPCQPFSLGGKARAADDARDMFPAYTKALAQIKPKAFICENVKGLTRESFSEYYNYILLRLQHPTITSRPDETWRDHASRLTRVHTSGVHNELRYELVPTVVDAADYGVPQHRHRVIIVGFRSDIEAKWAFPRPTHSGIALFEAQQNEEYWQRRGICLSERTGIRRPGRGDSQLRPWRTVRDALHTLPPVDSTWPSNHEKRDGARAYAGHTGSPLDEPSKAIKAGVHGVPGGENMIAFPDGSVRYYSVREAARIQTFPDGWVFSGSWGEALRQIGNAVPVELARVVASSVAVALREAEARAMLDDPCAILNTGMVTA